MTAFWQGPSPWFGMDQPPSWNARQARADDGDPRPAAMRETASQPTDPRRRPEADDFVRHSIQRNYR